MKIERGLARTFAGHIHWRACGPETAPAIVISHINQQSSALMVELLQALAPDFRAVAIDYPSHGHSDPFDGQPTIETYAQCFIEVMDSLGIRRATALGEAVGAGVSYALGANWADRIDRVIAVNTPYFEKGGSDVADIRKVRPTDASGFPAPRSLAFMRANDPEHAPVHPSQSWMDRINTAQFEIGRNRWQAVQAYELFDLFGTMQRLACPVLMLYGETFVYGRHRHMLHTKCPHARIEIVPGGNFCMTWERATDIAAHARAFAL
ncbi:MAG: alpha/beta fold hydrolase [Proteobacteria bacterium]|nr:alpha/beta fold hydrolase [Pseudomonadota bacterium]